MLHVYGSPLSLPSNKVHFCVKAMDLAHEYHVVDLRSGEHKRPDYLAVNPAGKVPAINDNGFCLAESNAIMRYLARSNDSPLYAGSIEDLAVIDQWLDFVSLHIWNGYSKVLFNLKFAPMMGVEVDQTSLADGRKFLGMYLPQADQRLGESRYLASDELTIADIALLAATDPSEMIDVDLSGYSNLVKWRDDLRLRPLYTSVHDHFGEGIFD
jgi:glutathione S-transferase